MARDEALGAELGQGAEDEAALHETRMGDLHGTGPERVGQVSAPWQIELRVAEEEEVDVEGPGTVPGGVSLVLVVMVVGIHLASGGGLQVLDPPQQPARRPGGVALRRGAKLSHRRGIQVIGLVEGLALLGKSPGAVERRDPQVGEPQAVGSRLAEGLEGMTEAPGDLVAGAEVGAEAERDRNLQSYSSSSR